MRFIFEIAVVGFAVGIGFRSVSEVSPAVSIWLMILSFGLALLWRHKDKSASVLLLSVVLLSVSLGILRTEISSWQFGVSELDSLVETKIELNGIISSEPEYKNKTVQFYVETKTDKVLVSTDRLNEIEYGDEVLVSGNLQKPDSFVTDLGRTFDYPGYLQARGVEYRMSFAEVVVVDKGFKNPLVSILLKGKHKFVDSIERIIPEPEVGLGSGLLLGVKSALGEDIEEDFRRTGIIHIVVLSGYNVMLVVAFILFIFSFFLPLHWRFIAGLTAIICFALIVGLSATRVVLQNIYIGKIKLNSRHIVC
jgi:competence protein ComEC